VIEKKEYIPNEWDCTSLALFSPPQQKLAAFLCAHPRTLVIDTAHIKTSVEDVPASPL
jgi:hypothetical protein